MDPTMTDQTRLMSFFEASTNTGIGYVTSLVAWPVIAALSPDVGYSPAGHAAIPAAMTVISVIRSYLVRRFFATQIHRFAGRLALQARRLVMWRRRVQLRVRLKLSEWR